MNAVSAYGVKVVERDVIFGELSAAVRARLSLPPYRIFIDRAIVPGLGVGSSIALLHL
jgi:hypothetical protein